MELAALLWGTLILVLFLYALLAALVIRVQMRKQAFVVEPEADVVEVGSPIPFHVVVSRMAVRPPGFRLRLELGLRWEDHDLGATFPVTPGSQTPSVPAHRRGAYSSAESRLVYEDALAFLRVARGDGSQLAVSVVPATLAGERIDRLSTPRGAKATHGRKRITSDEFLEIRPYIPGDDPRRLSWKHYAQLGDLMIRTGEPSPPPANELVCIVDSGWEADRASQAGRTAVADSIAFRGLSIIRGALNSGDSVVVAIRGIGQPVTLPAGRANLEPSGPLTAEAKLVLRAFAGLTVQRDPPDPAMPQVDSEALIIGSEASPSMASLVAKIRARGATAHVLTIPQVPLPPRTAPLSRLFCRDRAYA